MFTPDLLAKFYSWLMTTGAKILLIIVGTLFLIRIGKIFSHRAEKVFLRGREDEESIKRAKTLSMLLRHSLRAIIIIISLITILATLGIQIGPLLAAAGVLGLAVGFAAQSLIKDIINGFFIILWDQIRVGDVVQIAGKDGVVESINLKMTVLRDLSGNVHFIPNSMIDLVTNMSKGHSKYLFDISVSYFENIDEVIATLKEIDEEIRCDPLFSEDILEPLEILGVDRFDNSAIVIKARTTTKPNKQWRIGREFNRRLKLAFDRKGIRFPFPHLIVFAGEDKQGQASSFRVRLMKNKVDPGSNLDDKKDN